MTQASVEELLRRGQRYRTRCLAGSVQGVDASGVEIRSLDEIGQAGQGQLVIAVTGGQPVQAFQVDIAVRRAIAAGVAALLFISEVPVAETARLLAARSGLPVLAANGSASELAVFIDRIIRGGAAEALARAEYAIDQVVAAGAAGTGSARERILLAASSALGTPIWLDEHAAVAEPAGDAVWIGEVPIGRLTADSTDPAVTLALPVIAATLSRALQRELSDRFGPVRSRADLIIELAFAESSRIDALAIDATRAGLPIQRTHVVAWLTTTDREDPSRPRPSSLAAALELVTLQLVDTLDGDWHLAVFHEDLVLVGSEEPGAPDQQRRLAAAVQAIVERAGALIGRQWAITVGLGTPSTGASGLRQSTTEARIAAEAAVAAGRLGAVEATDVTGLRRILLDFTASPLSRGLLDDILAPLDALGGDRAATAVRTLLAYLRHRNSLARAAIELTLHPNAVNYRIRRIEQQLGVDLADPDVRFAVELACRVRTLVPQR